MLIQQLSCKQVFEWKQSNDNAGQWKEISKLCGRVTPPPLNSTTNKMKVLFRSNEAVQGDGFRALWTQNCGGVFDVTRDIGYIESPGYPFRYGRNLFCNYTLIAPDREIIAEFLDFSLEKSMWSWWRVNLNQ